MTDRGKERTMTDRELMQQALDALESSRVFVTSRETIKHPEGTEWYNERIEALRARLAQPKPEPVAWQCAECGGTHSLCLENRKDIPLYTALPQREWQGLTDEEKEHYRRLGFVGVEIIETILKEKNYDKS